MAELKDFGKHALHVKKKKLEIISIIISYIY